MGDGEIKPGDRFERLGRGELGISRGDVVTAARRWDGGGWAVEGSKFPWALSNQKLWRRLPRTDASTVKVGDVVKDPALLVGEPPPAPPPRCKPGCSPKEPCWEGSTDDGGCPAWYEGVTGAPRIDSNGISADAPARASTYQPRCAELAGWGSWNGRSGK